MSSEWISTVYGRLPAYLQSAPLATLCEKSGVQTGPFGSQLHSKDYVRDGTPIITVEHLGENRIIHGNLPRVADEDKSRLSKYLLRAGDIVFSRVGSVDRRVLVQPKEAGWLFSGRCLRVRPKPELIDSRWLSYFFGMVSFKDYIRSIAVGATMPSINTKILSDVPIYFPSLKIQKEAADFLVALDNRISLIHETNTTLEAIAQALFKSWFVDFDPVRAKAEGRHPEGIDAETAALFPDSFEESELGLVPKGWRVGALNDICKITSGKRPCNRSDIPTSSVNIPLYGGAGVMGFTTKTLYSDHKILTGRVGTLGQVHIAHPPFWASDNVLVLSPFNNRDFYVCLHWLKVINMYRLNRGSTQPLLTQKDLGSQKIAISLNNVSEMFADIVTPIYNKISECNQQYQTLTSLRDTLLPRLVSGRLQLPYADILINEATT